MNENDTGLTDLIGESEASTVAALTRAASEVIQITEHVSMVRSSLGFPTLVNHEQFAPAPTRTRRRVTVQSIGSFLEYIKAQQVPAEVWANRGGGVEGAGPIEALFGVGNHVAPGWGDHSCRLRLTPSPEWNNWQEISGQLVAQDQFAEFIEDHLSHIIQPDAATMMELVQKFNATNKVTFESSHLTKNGARVLQYKDDLKATAGGLEIPTTITLAIRPFVGSDRFQVVARFRYRIDQRGLLLGVKLDQPELVVEEAFNDALAAIRDAGVVVYEGEGGVVYVPPIFEAGE